MAVKCDLQASHTIDLVRTSINLCSTKIDTSAQMSSIGELDFLTERTGTLVPAYSYSLIISGDTCMMWSGGKYAFLRSVPGAGGWAGGPQRRITVLDMKATGGESMRQ